jgi:alpha-galactosidase
MGWNGWNTFACTAELDQAKFRANADALVTSGLHAVGYEYMNLDDCWQAGGRGADGSELTSSTRFPDGLAALGSYVHQKGLKFGLNSNVGSCMRSELITPGSSGHETQDAATYAGFGIDYVKYGSCGGSRSTNQASYETMRDALTQTGRPMLLSVVDAPFKYWHQQVGQLWRTHGDILPNWQGLLDILDATTKLAPYAGQGGYNDADMLWVGNPALSEVESRAHFAAWAILASPLIAGNDLTVMSEATRAILGQSDLIALNQDPLRLQAALLATQQNVMVLAKPLAQCGARGVVLLNRGDSAARGTVTWHDLALEKGAALAHNLWAGTDSTEVDGITVNVAAHDAVALRIVGSELPLPRGDVSLSDLAWTYAANGWGPVERDQEVGETAANDGMPLSLGGQRYPKGLGVNSPALVRYRLGKRCQSFTAWVGLDDETAGAGSVAFQVWADGDKLFDSGVVTGGSPAQHINVDVSGRSELRLWVGEVDDIAQDHADWADARIHCND